MARTSVGNLGSLVNLDKAIELGEYDVNYLSRFDEWKELPRNSQWQLIRRAIRNRKTLLRVNYAEIFNQLNFSEKPELAKALKNVEKQLKKLNEDEEKLQIEYSI
ncbi:hypothetical protein KKA02_01105 [Patescibacteria group bacterium]|nr:hypothetical protein [Patescibacteria group bacterium]